MDFPTMTLHECCEAFRANQISVTEEIMSASIEANCFPEFARPLAGGSRRNYMIFRKPFYKWLESLIEQPVIKI